MKEIKFLNSLPNIASTDYVVYSKNFDEIFFFQNDSLFQWNVNDNNSIELCPELDFTLYKIFYRKKDNTILIVGDAIYLFNMASKQIDKLFDFDYNEDTYFNYLEEIDSFVATKNCSDSKIMVFNIESLNITIYPVKLTSEVSKVKYFDDRIFLILKFGAFESRVEVYDKEFKDLISEFTYNDYIYDLIYFKAHNQLIFQYVSADPKPNFIEVYDFEKSQIQHINNPSLMNIINISDYNEQYFISFSKDNHVGKVTLWEKDLSSIFSYNIGQGDVCIFPENEFKRFMTFNKNNCQIYLWEFI